MYSRVIGHEFRPVPSTLQGRYAPHPLREAVLSPGIYGPVTHTAEEHRATVNLNKAPNAKLVFVYGASTTYDNGVADNLTWSSALSRHFGTRLCRREPWGAGIFNGPAHYSSFVRFPQLSSRMRSVLCGRDRSARVQCNRPEAGLFGFSPGQAAEHGHRAFPDPAALGTVVSVERIGSQDICPAGTGKPHIRSEAFADLPAKHQADRYHHANLRREADIRPGNLERSTADRGFAYDPVALHQRFRRYENFQTDGCRSRGSCQRDKLGLSCGAAASRLGKCRLFFCEGLPQTR